MSQKPRIVVTRMIHSDALRLLADSGEVELWTEPKPMPRHLLQEWLKDAEACLSMLTDRIDDAALEQAPSLKIVANMAVGFDNIDLSAATRHRVMVSNTPDVLTEATAELTWALILALARNLLSAREDLLQGRWTVWSPDGFLGTELYGKTLGIVGLGRIGHAVARRAPAFGMDVVALGRSGHAAPGSIPRLTRDEFLTRADVVSLHVPLTPDTRHLVNAEWLAHMKPSAYLINTARGAVVDEQALWAALNQGRLAGAALDVFQKEPVDGSHPLASHPRVLATPHIGSATAETRRAMAIRAAENIRSVLQGHPPRDWLNP